MAVAKAPSESSLPDRVVVRLIEAQEREESGRRLHRVVNNARPPGISGRARVHEGWPLLHFQPRISAASTRAGYLFLGRKG